MMGNWSSRFFEPAARMECLASGPAKRKPDELADWTVWSTEGRWSGSVLIADSIADSTAVDPLTKR